MRIKLSRHSKNNMRLYKISEEDILMTLKAPDVKGEETGKITAIKKIQSKFSGYPLKVIYTIKEKEIFVITVYPLKKKIWR